MLTLSSCFFFFAAASPNCAQAQLIWQHGNFSQNANGSLTLTPFEGDGRQMIQNGCTQVSSTVSYYGQREFFTGFYIRTDWHFGQGNYYLQLYEFDGTPKPWMWQTYNPPQMLPTTPLKQVVSASITLLSDALCLFSLLLGLRITQWRYDDDNGDEMISASPRTIAIPSTPLRIIDTLYLSWTFPACSLVASPRFALATLIPTIGILQRHSFALA
jgi:hypothetical protein